MARKTAQLLVGILMVGLGVGVLGLLVFNMYVRPLQIQREALANFVIPTAAVEVAVVTSTPFPTEATPTIISTLLPSTPTTTPQVTDFLLEIPAIKLSWMVHEILEPDLNDPWRIPKTELDQYGVVRFPEMAFPGQVGVTALAGHRDIAGSPFLWLDRLQIGDEIRIILQDGTVLLYAVFDKVYVTPYNLEVLEPQFLGEEEFRLVTCLVGSTRQRLIIFASRKKGEK